MEKELSILSGMINGAMIGTFGMVLREIILVYLNRFDYIYETSEFFNYHLSFIAYPIIWFVLRRLKVFELVKNMGK